MDLVLQPRGHYREIARLNWGLTKEQMKGMHVHHRIPRSKGGTNDPTNLYVCSPWFHSHVWHAEDGIQPHYIAAAAKGGRANKGKSRNKGVPKSEAHKEAIRRARTGVPHPCPPRGPMSEEHKRKIREGVLRSLSRKT